jgi:serine/threonine-protein kinase
MADLNRVDPPEDERLAELLDAYLRELQAGRHPDRAAIVSEHPEMASLVEYLDALERIAPPSGDALEPSASAEIPSSFLDVPQPAMPQDFGAYELLGEIGCGGMGVVYKARQKGLERIVAVKMILASHLASPDQVRRFQEEARAAAGLRHPHIVHIHEVGQCHGQHYFAMEYIEGMSLAERLARGPLEAEEAARLVLHVARAVEHLHQHGYIHRDLKPSNILLDAEGEPYVSDFGLAKAFAPGSAATTTGVIAGTPSYMSPEQAAGHNAEVGRSSDVYSLGAILYEAMTGRPPFRAESALDTLLAVLGGEPELPRRLNRRLPRELELICLKCLSRSPQDRYATAGGLADDLDRFLKGEALEARPPHLPQRIWRWARREPALSMRLAALGVFYAVEWVNYSAGIIDGTFHGKMTILIALWSASAIVFQQWVKARPGSIPARFGWGAIDSALFLSILLVADGAASPLIAGYSLLIVASGLWYRVRFVWFMTALSMLSYGVLIFDFYVRRAAELQKVCSPGIDRHVIFLVAMVLLAAATSYLVARIRTLSGYFGQKL